MFYCGAARLATAAATCALPVVPRCGAARLAAAACALPAMLPLGGCASCHAVVLPASPPLLPPARCLSCCRQAVACRVTLWCCLPRHRCLRAACHVTVGQLRVVPHCGAAHITAACALPVVLPSGSCMSCSGVLLPALPPLLLPCCS